jgi:hypothetical protein
MRKTVTTLILGLTLGGTNICCADENGERLVYLGIGNPKTGNKLESDATPVSLGFMKISNSDDAVFGGDISGEGTMVDSTYGQKGTVKQAFSFNALLGRNLVRTDGSRFDGALLLGLRQKGADCPASLLGYQCYADRDPNMRYGFNYGAVFTWTYKSLLLGVRASGESTQALVGVRF